MARPEKSAEILTDLAIVGAGSGGLSVAAVSAQLGLRTVLIERGAMGGDCLNTGCVPSKALLAAAHAAQRAGAMGRFGLSAGAVRVDWGAVRTHVEGVIEAVAPADSVERFEKLGVTVLRAEARFIARDALKAGEATIRARRIVVAAGSHATVPDIPGLKCCGFVTHESLFDLARRPTHLLILGGGAIGLEMAQAHVGLGCAVTIVTQGRLGGREDPELVEVLRRTLLDQGVRILENVTVTAAEAGPTLRLADGRVVAGSDLLVATGRTPNLAALDLPAGGIASTTRGIATNAALRSISNRIVYAVGDIADPAGIGPRYLTHAASHAAGIVLRAAVFRLPARLSAVMPRAIYTEPELAQVGLTEAEARAAGHDVRILRWTLDENDRAKAERSGPGLTKLVISRRGRVLGAGIVAPHAGETIGTWTLAIQQRIRLSALADLIVPYPTLAEAGKRAAGQYFQSRLFSNVTKILVRLLSRLP